VVSTQSAEIDRLTREIKEWIEQEHEGEIRDESNFWGIDDSGEG